ncbi:hypothetical protein OLMES_0187 [Oleiphilus messinensis]|uniref:Knr4/Smi1-like domain-containing protein n=1 Tax=Oleiphilus messinensis TaxID=141451 RepID=A0A1Y0I4B1_9GAMM|nr:SMI1/KNR4 family protein [Oleiphilus messinensis]ARU54294.1 hypothetical protein OLMES_0187 [Oleiphilus messinensis]
MSNIENLKHILNPPLDPLETDTDWDPVENQLGIKLPQDYKDFITSYGTGSVDSFLWIFNPFSKNQNINLFKCLETYREVFEYLDKNTSEIAIFSLFPAARGLLPFAATDNGDVLFWLVDGDPENWSIVINDARQDEYEKFDVSLVAFLTDILSNKLKSDVLPVGFPTENPSFRSIC